MLTEEKQKRSAKETGRVVLMDWFTPAVFTENETALIRFIEVPLKSFINELNDYVAQGFKIFNMLNNKESVVALKVAGAKIPSEHVEAMVDEARFIAAGSRVYYIFVDSRSMEPVKVYKVELKGL